MHDPLDINYWPQDEYILNGQPKKVFVVPKLSTTMLVVDSKKHGWWTLNDSTNMATMIQIDQGHGIYGAFRFFLQKARLSDTDILKSMIIRAESKVAKLLQLYQLMMLGVLDEHLAETFIEKTQIQNVLLGLNFVPFRDTAQHLRDELIQICDAAANGQWGKIARLANIGFSSLQIRTICRDLQFCKTELEQALHNKSIEPLRIDLIRQIIQQISRIDLGSLSEDFSEPIFNARAPICEATAIMRQPDPDLATVLEMVNGALICLNR